MDAVNDHYWELLKANPDAAEHCQRCGRAYSLVWRAPDELWHAVTGCMDGGGLYCPECFVSMAREKGIEVYWDACRAEEWYKPAAAAPGKLPLCPFCAKPPKEYRNKGGSKLYCCEGHTNEMPEELWRRRPLEDALRLQRDILWRTRVPPAAPGEKEE